MRTILIASLVAAAAASPVAAQQSQTQLASAAGNNSAQTVTDAKPAPAAPAVEPKKVCKRLPSSYSKRSDRVCLTEREWAQVEQDSQS